jgi:hypothetical protein
MRVRPSLFVMAALAVATATGCGSSSDSGEAETTGAATTATTATTPTTAATTPDGEPATSPVSVLGSTVSVEAGQVEVSLRLRQPADTDPPIAKTAHLRLPEGIEWKGADTPSCDAETLARGIDACPPAAIIGSGEAVGLADTSKTVGTITAINGGEDDVYLATVVRNPAYVKTVVPGKIAKGDDGLELDLTFPKALQTIAGVPVGLQQLQLTVKRGPTLVVPACPDDGWSYDARVGFDDGTQVEHAGKATCSG